MLKFFSDNPMTFCEYFENLRSRVFYLPNSFSGIPFENVDMKIENPGD